ncbi:aldehyde dehydrogenase (NADP(+)) [Runella slithyformis]|uniref:Aldehyde dehydrogenase (NADP(+)) n=1 Tax=Runella slithyformis (strain ATCC 29530 / DSM 19594 / LMG 11500 / NCIMB 11436 / LSU 4) TaxID=761193 RepID=A0A7U4E7B8_RUNSL|nr:aldehyde dehydrogenase (NADP(+)) [Runella slithyformis]AEI50214.1 Aldehyde dehydrogenase (NADP(+)) [Runella slithyformis DSM 19594]
MFQDATTTEIEAAMQRAYAAFLHYRHTSGKDKAVFIRTVADEVEATGDAIIAVAMRETHLPADRLLGERARTCFQLRNIADVVEEGSWVEATIDTALPDRRPLPKPDIRNMSVPIGPVVVFGASNFPFAYSTAGVDPASAWGAGCPVVVKAHPAHPETSEMVANAVKRAIAKTGMPEGIFEHVHGAGFEVGTALVLHPKTAAVGFTGSYAGGKALFDLAAKRPVPIPVFAEMGSINPVFLLEGALQTEAEKYAKLYAASITGGMGQFCTKPGLLIGIEGDGLTAFERILAGEISRIAPVAMLHPGIAKAFRANRSEVLIQKTVTIQGETVLAYGENDGIPSVASVSAGAFMNNPALHREVFGPFSLLVKCRDAAEMKEVISHLEGQLTCTVIGSAQDLAQAAELVAAVSLLCGRLIVNGVPTGVEVGAAMQHGGPFPASTDGRFGSVGPHAMKRFVRPLAFQNFPTHLLPDELKDGNPLDIWRRVNGHWGKD